MAKTGIFASLNYKLYVQPCLQRISHASPKLQQMAKSVPASVYVHWRDTAAKEFPGINTSPQNFAVSCSALLQFFHMSALEKSPMMLPSKAADSVWHTWMDHDKEGLSTFLKTHLNQDIGHVEKASMTNDPAKSMANTWRAAHDYSNNVQFAGNLPSIFDADKVTGMPGGFWYDRDPEDRRAAYYHNMDEKGLPDLMKLGTSTLSWPNVYDEMTPARRTKADNEIQMDYQEPAGGNRVYAAAMASLGIAAGTTAAAFLAQREIALEQAELNRARGADAGAPHYSSGPGGDDGGSSCGSSCGGD